MTFIGMYGIPIVGEVGPDGAVNFDTKYLQAKKDQYRRCKRCGKMFRLQRRFDPMIICQSCLDGGERNR